MEPGAVDPEVDKIYEYVCTLIGAKDRARHVSEYEGIISVVSQGRSNKAKQLAAHEIPRFFKFFPSLAERAVNAQLDLIELDDVATRVQAIRGLPLLCKDAPENVSMMAYVLGQLLVSEENIERDAVHKALMSLLCQDVKVSLNRLFGLIGGSDDDIRVMAIQFLKDKVFPVKAELLIPQDEMERYVAELVKGILQDVTEAEFETFLDFLSSLSIFGASATQEHVQELEEIIEGQADLHARFDVSDIDHIERLNSCMSMAIPYFARGASCSKFLNYLNKHVLPVFDKLPEEKMPDLLRTLAGTSPYATASDACLILPSIVQLLRNHMPRGTSREGMNITFVECLLYIFHNLARKAPSTTNSLCGYRFFTGQPSDRLGEDFSGNYEDFTERLRSCEDLVKAALKKLTRQVFVASKNEQEKAQVETERQNFSTALRGCHNILAMTQPLHSKTPWFIGDNKIILSWQEPLKGVELDTIATGGNKRAAASDCSELRSSKKGRGDGFDQDQHVKYLSRGGRRGARGSRVQGGRGRPRSYR